MESRTDFSHLRREIRTALELAIAALAPTELLDRLARAAGLLEALSELPPNTAPVLALGSKLIGESKSSLSDWQSWQTLHHEDRFPRC